MVLVGLVGATGGCGTAFLNLALERGHSVRVLARTPSKLTVEHKELTVVQGDATVQKDVETWTTGCDLIVSCVGNSDKKMILNTVANNIVNSMPPRCYFITSLGMNGSSGCIRLAITL